MIRTVFSIKLANSYPVIVSYLAISGFLEFLLKSPHMCVLCFQAVVLLTWDWAVTVPAVTPTAVQLLLGLTSGHQTLAGVCVSVCLCAGACVCYECDLLRSPLSGVLNVLLLMHGAMTAYFVPTNSCVELLISSVLV